MCASKRNLWWINKNHMDSSAGTNSTDLYVDSVHIWDDATSSYQQVQAGGVTEGEMDAAIAAAVAPVSAAVAAKMDTTLANSLLDAKDRYIRPPFLSARWAELARLWWAWTRSRT